MNRPPCSLTVTRPKPAQGEVRTYANHIVEADVNLSFAPGTPLRIDFRRGERSASVDAKTIGSRKLEGGLFRVRMKIVNAAREIREWIESELP